MSKFQQDLKNGKEYESKALSDIQLKYPKAYIIDGYCLDWDIYIPELKIGVEVKSDAQYQKTGNFYVEYFCNGKPSGIATTKADLYYIHSIIQESASEHTMDVPQIIGVLELVKIQIINDAIDEDYDDE